MTRIRITVDSVNWTAVVTPIQCKTVILENDESGSNDVYQRIVDTDANTQKLIPAGTGRVSEKSFSGESLSARTFFAAGSTVSYVKSVSGSFDVTADCIE